MGLILSKLIVERLGGEIWVEQNEIQGSTIFCFTMSIETTQNLAAGVAIDIDAE